MINKHNKIKLAICILSLIFIIAACTANVEASELQPIEIPETSSEPETIEFVEPIIIQVEAPTAAETEEEDEELEYVFISSNHELTEEEKQVNAEYIYYYLHKWGWSDNAIFAVLGNADHESYLNPGKWQNGHAGNTRFGFGLVQWTPAGKKIIAWANENGKDPESLMTQLEYLELLSETGEGWCSHKKHSQSFYDFSRDPDHTTEWLTGSFYYNYEMPGDNSLRKRVKLAYKWETYFAEAE